MTNEQYTKKDPVDLQTRHTVICEALSREYISIAEIDLTAGSAVVLKSTEDTELEGREIPWGSLVQRYARRRAYTEDADIIYTLTLDCLEEFLAGGKDELALEVRCTLADGSCTWVKICITVLSAEEKKLLVTTKNIHEDRMRQRILDIYVYQNMDYFILLDAKHDSYTIFSGNQHGIPVPSEHCNDYTAEMIRYNNQYVVTGDLERVTANMQIPHVLEMLDKTEQYSFSCGSLSDTKEYRRTRVQYQYYDKSMGLILLTRTDITQIYMDEQAKHRRLAIALRDAQHDSLTDIFNQKATAELICGSLESRYWSQAAFLFIDVDNFKMANDTLGHQTGDRLLQHLAASIKQIAGRDGIAGRVGGDEFLLFLPIASCKEDIEAYADKICHIFDSCPDNTVDGISLTCSVGISRYPLDGEDYKVLVQKADQALYTSKRYGKSRYYFYSEE